MSRRRCSSRSTRGAGGSRAGSRRCSRRAPAVLGGAVLTLMTWMQQGTSSMIARAVPAITAAFLLAGAQLNHAIVNSLLMFSALDTGHAPFGYLQWAETAGWAAVGNIAGG